MPAGGPLTDAFDGTSSAVWALSNPNGDADSTAVVSGGVLTLHFNGPPGCDLVHGDSNSPAYLQDVDDVDFDIRMRVNTALLGLGASGSGYVMVVLVAFNAARNQWVSWGEFNNPSSKAWAYRDNGTTGTEELNSTSVDISGSAPWYYRLVRSGNTWTCYNSTNGTSWTQRDTFTHALVVDKVGIVWGGGSTATNKNFVVDTFTGDGTATTVTGTLAGTGPTATGALTGSVRASATLTGTGPAATGSLTAAVRVSGTLAGTGPAATGVLTGDVSTPITGTLAGVGPSATAALTGTLDVGAVLAGTGPAATADLDVEAVVEGVAAGTGPAAVAALDGELVVAGVLDGAGPPAEADLEGAVPDDVAGVLDGLGPAAVSDLALEAEIEGFFDGVAAAAEALLSGTVEQTFGDIIVGPVSGPARVPAPALAGPAKEPRLPAGPAARILAPTLGVRPVEPNGPDRVPGPVPTGPAETHLVVGPDVAVGDVTGPEV